MADTNIIQLNGKHYDVVSGKLLSRIEVKSDTTKSSHLHAAAHHARTIDGFVQSHHQPSQSKPIQTNYKAGHHSAVEVVKVVKKPAVRRTTSPVVAHKPEPAKTLMRHAVKKPVVKPSVVARIQSLAGVAPITRSSTPTAAAREHNLNEQRLTRAQNIPKSKDISRFRQRVNQNMFVKRSIPLGVKTAPVQRDTSYVNPVNSLAEASLARAKSHEQRFHRKLSSYQRLARTFRVKSRTLSLVASSLVVILIVGFFGYQNAPNINVRIAAARAGVHATLPGFKPAGFAFSNRVMYRKGEITINYHSVSDQRNFSIVQTASSWDSQTLYDNFVANTNNNNYQTLNVSGRTIYVYGNGNATWVNGGIWYLLVGNANLSNDQLLNIINSM